MAPPLPQEWDTWREEAARLAAAPPLRRSEVTTQGSKDCKFALGDFLRSVPSQWVDRLAEALGQEPSAFRSYREVADRFPPEARVASSWTVHRDLRNQPSLLRPGLTVRKAAELLGKRPIDSKPSHRQTIGERADQVRALLADPEVAAVIEAEKHLSKEERKARMAARNYASELQATAKLLDKELKEAQQARSPFEATVKALLELHKATQIVDGLRELAGDMEEPGRITSAIIALIGSATEALETFDAIVFDGTRVVDGEVWQARPEAYGSAESAQRSLPPTGRVIDQTGG